MPFVQWSEGIFARVHISSNRGKTLCGRPVPASAAETAKAPKDKSKICQACRKIEQEEKRFQRFLK